MPKIYKRQKPDTQLAFKLPRATLARLKELAIREDRSMSAQLLRALQIYLDNPDECERLRRESDKQV